MAFPLSEEEHNQIQERIDSQEELIVAVAVRVDGAIISFPRPARHGECLNWLSKHGIPRDKARDHGFLTNRGRYVDRKEAGAIVIASKQGTPFMNEEANPHGHLFSEDMWNCDIIGSNKKIDPEDIF